MDGLGGRKERSASTARAVRFHGGRQREAEDGALVGGILDPDPPAVPLDDLLAEGEPDTGTGVLVAPVQALEDLEDALAVRLVDADAVVAHGELKIGRAHV